MDKKWKSNTEEKWVKLTTAVAHPCGVPVFAPLSAFPPHFPRWYQWGCLGDRVVPGVC